MAALLCSNASNLYDYWSARLELEAGMGARKYALQRQPQRSKTGQEWRSGPPPRMLNIACCNNGFGDLSVGQPTNLPTNSPLRMFGKLLGKLASKVTSVPGTPITCE